MSSSRVCFLPIEGSGGEGMVKTEVWHEIHSRWKLKEKKRAIARAVGRAPLVSTRFDRRQPRDLYSLRMREGANCHKEARPTDTAKKQFLINY